MDSKQSLSGWRVIPFCRPGKIIWETLYNELISNNLSRSHFTKYFTNRSGDFGISFDGCETVLSVPWHDVIHYLLVVMFFGWCFDHLLPWGPVFCFKTDPKYAQHVFRRFASEYFGDLQASAQLFGAYKDCMCSVNRSQCIEAESKYTETIAKIPNFSFEHARMFQSSFDIICQHSFLNCFLDFNDYSMPILQTSDFTAYLHASKRIFPQQWAFLSSHCNVNPERDGNDLTKFKERQVFISLLALQRQSNFRCLPHWCLILLTAMYGWGAHKKLGHAIPFLGRTVSWSYRDQFYSSLTLAIVETVIRLLSSQVYGLMGLDNFQHGNQLSDQRGGRSSKFLIGTTKAAHCVFLFLDFQWDQCKTEMMYCQQQIIPSPLGMQSYETNNMTLPSLRTNLFTNHLQIPISHKPCFSGERVKVYKNTIRSRWYILAIQSSLSHDYTRNCDELPESSRCAPVNLYF
jgi:hypothetical protein